MDVWLSFTKDDRSINLCLLICRETHKHPNSNTKDENREIYVHERHTTTAAASTFELTRVSNISRVVNMISCSPAIQVEVIGIEDLYSRGSDFSWPASHAIKDRH